MYNLYMYILKHIQVRSPKQRKRRKGRGLNANFTVIHRISPAYATKRQPPCSVSVTRVVHRPRTPINLLVVVILMQWGNRVEQRHQMLRFQIDVGSLTALESQWYITSTLSPQQLLLGSTLSQINFSKLTLLYDSYVIQQKQNHRNNPVLKTKLPIKLNWIYHPIKLVYK